MVDPTVSTTNTEPDDPEDAIPRDPEPIRRSVRRRQYHPDSGIPDGLVAGFIGFGLGVITVLAFRQATDNDDDDRDYRYRSYRSRD